MIGESFEEVVPPFIVKGNLTDAHFILSLSNGEDEFELAIDQQMIKDNQLLSEYLPTITDLYSHMKFVVSKNLLKITKEGLVYFQIKLYIDSSLQNPKIKELSIQTIKKPKPLTKQQVLEIKIANLQQAQQLFKKQHQKFSKAQQQFRQKYQQYKRQRQEFNKEQYELKKQQQELKTRIQQAEKGIYNNVKQSQKITSQTQKKHKEQQLINRRLQIQQIHIKNRLFEISAEFRSIWAQLQKKKKNFNRSRQQIERNEKKPVSIAPIDRKPENKTTPAPTTAPSFIIDYTNPHINRFKITGNKVQKVKLNDVWHPIIGKRIPSNAVSLFRARQSGGTNKMNVLYGIATSAITVEGSSINHKQSMSYYAGTGWLWVCGDNPERDVKPIKKNEIVQVRTDTRTWKIQWFKEGQKQAEFTIPDALREKVFYQVIWLAYLHDQVELL